MSASPQAVAAVQKALGCNEDRCTDPTCACQSESNACNFHGVNYVDRGCPVAVAAADSAVDAEHLALGEVL